VIVGATGMVGGCALRYALDHPAVGTVTAVGRKRLGISHPKLQEVLHQDFADCSALAEALSHKDAAVFCIGRSYRRGVGRGAPQDNRGLHDRVRASSPRQEPRGVVLILKREWRGLDRTKSDFFRTL
jgi:putative NADH-flavin reductase